MNKYRLILLIATAVMLSAVPASAMSPEATYPFRTYCTGSMEPILTCKTKQTGVFLSFEEKKNLPIGAVITYEPRCWENYNTWICGAVKHWAGSGYIIHRIVAKTPEGYYITRGDANQQDDDVVVKPAMILFWTTEVDGIAV